MDFGEAEFGEPRKKLHNYAIWSRLDLTQDGIP